jgi:hypothetical protein
LETGGTGTVFQQRLCGKTKAAVKKPTLFRKKTAFPGLPANSSLPGPKKMNKSP